MAFHLAAAGAARHDVRSREWGGARRRGCGEDGECEPEGFPDVSDAVRSHADLRGWGTTPTARKAMPPDEQGCRDLGPSRYEREVISGVRSERWPLPSGNSVGVRVLRTGWPPRQALVAPST